ncbi:MAG TPA: hypothetical protein VFF39_13055 [Verrucomicrobiae bacterium]|nr:hypothetical protein [Verrucomicrobiae bacterium]
MLNSHSIPPELWLRARRLLIFYFSRRHGIQKAEDLAHDTLAAVWGREDFVFEKEEDFLRVCYGFARMILHEAYRDEKKHAWTPLDPAMEKVATDARGLKGTELSAFLREVFSAGEANMAAEEWAVIGNAIGRDEDDGPVNGKLRVKLHRARKKLAKITGWQKSEV